MINVNYIIHLQTLKTLIRGFSKPSYLGLNCFNSPTMAMSTFLRQFAIFYNIYESYLEKSYQDLNCFNSHTCILYIIISMSDPIYNGGVILSL